MRNASDKSLCPLCGGKKVPGRTTYVATFAPGLLVVRNVPAMICSQCGEEWIDAKTAQQLEKMVTEAKQRKHELEVVAL